MKVFEFTIQFIGDESQLFNDFVKSDDNYYNLRERITNLIQNFDYEIINQSLGVIGTAQKINDDEKSKEVN